MSKTQRRGGELLRRWLEDERRSQEWIADQIGTHQTNVSRWIRGWDMPLDMAIAIRKVTGIEVETWVQPGVESGPIEDDEAHSAAS